MANWPIPSSDGRIAKDRRVLHAWGDLLEQFQLLSAQVVFKHHKAGGVTARQELRVSDGEFNTDMSVEEILTKVAREVGSKQAIALAEAFELDPADYDLSGKPVPEPSPLAPKPLRLGHSQYATKQPNLMAVASASSRLNCKLPVPKVQKLACSR